MGHMIFGNTDMEDLRKKATKLTSAIESLSILLEQEADRLKRKDEAARLKLLRSAILQQAEWDRNGEMAASSGYNFGKLVSSVILKGAGLLIAETSEDEKLRAAARSLLAEPVGEKRTFGTVLVRIDAKGLPDGVDVVSISRLGRESHQKEPEVISGLEKHGYLLLSEEDFSRLIDKLVKEILEGQLTLPVNTKTLSQMQTSRPLRLDNQHKD